MSEKLHTSKRVLILAYYFPPLGMGGTQRATKFVKYLPEFGWEPVVVTVKDVAYYATDPTLLAGMSGRRIHRTGSLDPQRLLYLLTRRRTGAVSGTGPGRDFVNKLLALLLVPDAKILWLPFAIFTAWKISRREKVDCVLTTSPPHSAHLAGLALKYFLGMPWIADFRDGWAGGNFQAEPTAVHSALNRWLQNWIVRKADKVIAVSDGLAGRLQKATGKECDKFEVLTNGFDADDFRSIGPEANPACFSIIYSGALTKMTPLRPFLLALAAWIREMPELGTKIRVRLVGHNLEPDLETMCRELGLSENVEFTGYLPHARALEIVCGADLLLYPVAPDASDDFVPGKTFEYLASGRRILAYGPCVEGVRILQRVGSRTVLAQANIPSIKQALQDIQRQQEDGGRQPDLTPLAAFERKHLTKKLAEILDSLA